MNEITISKGGHSVTIYVRRIEENYRNKLFLITAPKNASTQDVGANDTKVVDLLRLTHQIQINEAYICGTSSKVAKSVKDDLKTIINGAGQKGGEITLTYDGDSHKGYIESCTFSEEAMDQLDFSDLPEDVIRYSVQLTFVIGVQV